MDAASLANILLAVYDGLMVQALVDETDVRWTAVSHALNTLLADCWACRIHDFIDIFQYFLCSQAISKAYDTFFNSLWTIKTEAQSDVILQLCSTGKQRSLAEIDIKSLCLAA